MTNVGSSRGGGATPSPTSSSSLSAIRLSHDSLERIGQADFALLSAVAEHPELVLDAPPTVRHGFYSACLNIVADSRGILSSGSGVKPESGKALKALAALLRSQAAGLEFRQLLRHSGVDEVRRLKLHRHIMSQKEGVRPAALDFVVYVTELLAVPSSEAVSDSTSGTIVQAIETHRMSMQRQLQQQQQHQQQLMNNGGGTTGAAARPRDDADDEALAGSGSGGARVRALSRGPPSSTSTAAAAAAGPAGLRPPAPSRPRSHTTAGGALNTMTPRLQLPSRPSSRQPATNPLYSSEPAPSDLPLPQDDDDDDDADGDSNSASAVPDLVSVMSPSAVTFFAKHFGFGCIPSLPDSRGFGEHHRAVTSAALQASTNVTAASHQQVYQNAAAGGGLDDSGTSGLLLRRPKVVPTRPFAPIASPLLGRYLEAGIQLGWGTAASGELGADAALAAKRSPYGGVVAPIPLGLRFPAPADTTTNQAAETPAPAVPVVASLGQAYTAWLLMNGTVATHGNGDWGQLGVGPPPPNAATAASSQPAGRPGSAASQDAVNTSLVSPSSAAGAGATPTTLAGSFRDAIISPTSATSPAAAAAVGPSPPGGSSFATPSPLNTASGVFFNSAAAANAGNNNSSGSSRSICSRKPCLVARSSRSAAFFARLRAGFAFAATITDRGDLCLWGNNNHGQCGVGSPVSEERAIMWAPSKVSLKGTPIVDIAPGSFFVVGLTVTRAVVSWGALSMLGIGTEEEAMAAIVESRRFTAASRTLKAVTTTPVRVTALDRRQICAVAAGPWHAVAVSSAGVVYTWGVGHQGRLGHGDCEPQYAPKAVDGLLDCKVARVACGSFHTVVLTAAGVAFAFGDNAAGQCGIPGHAAILAPRRVAVPSTSSSSDAVVAVPFLDVACGREHTVLLTASGDVWCCGSGVATGFADRRDYSDVPRIVCARHCVLSIASGVSHAVALAVPRRLAVIVIGDLGPSPQPSQQQQQQQRTMPLARCVLSAAAGSTASALGGAGACLANGAGFSIFSDDNGALLGVGSGDWGQLGIGAVTPNADTAMPVVASAFPVSRTSSAGGRGDGLTTASAGSATTPAILHVAAGFAFAFALAANGQVFAWGNNNHGQCAVGLHVPRLVKPVLVTALSFAAPPASSTSSAATPTGPAHPTVPLAVRAPVVQIACGSFFGLALTSDGAVYSWGHTECCAIPPEELAAQASLAARVAADDAAALSAWRGVSSTASGGGGGASADPAAAAMPSTAATAHHHTADVEPLAMADSGAGSAAAAAASSSPPLPEVLGVSLTNERRAVLARPVRVPGLEHVTALAAGQWHAAALDAAGSVFTWGLGHQGRLGHGGSSPCPVPRRVVMPTIPPAMATPSAHPRESGIADPVVKIACGSFNTAAVTARGVLFAWGDNEHGQCGFASPLISTDKPAAAAVPSSSSSPVGSTHVVHDPIVDVSFGRHHMVAVDVRGQAWFAGKLALSGGHADHEVTIRSSNYISGGTAGGGGSSSLRSLASALATASSSSTAAASSSSLPTAAALVHAVAAAVDAGRAGPPTGSTSSSSGSTTTIAGVSIIKAACGASHVTLLVEYDRPSQPAVQEAWRELAKYNTIDLRPPAPTPTANSGDEQAPTVPAQQPQRARPPPPTAQRHTTTNGAGARELHRDAFSDL